MAHHLYLRYPGLIDSFSNAFLKHLYLGSCDLLDMKIIATSLNAFGVLPGSLQDWSSANDALD